MKSGASFKVGVDVGGTFTDLIAIDPATGMLHVAKVPTTTGHQSDGFISGLERLGVPYGQIESLVHGTTIGTNAVLERKGGKCGLITTRGFRDVLELGRRSRPSLYGMVGRFEAMIPRDMRTEVTERIGARGEILEPLDEQEVAEAVRFLLDRGAESVVILFMHSYINPLHEERCAKIVHGLWPNDYVTTSSVVLREVREFERGTAAALNGYIQPVIGSYIARLSEGLAGKGFTKDLLIMQGNGGMMSAAVTAAHAVHSLLSGPAAGVIAAAETGDQAGFRNIISCDMGGTSFDVAVIIDGQPAISEEMDIDYAVPVRIPMIDIHTIGAGGGSIARIDQAGLLQVGPESAGAVPGSICYGRGGTVPTVTDANLVMGRINPASITGVAGTVDVAHVRAIIEQTIAIPLALSVEEAAAAIVTVANNQMAQAIRLISIEKGYDPRDFILFAFGGAGPLHIVALARELNIPAVLVPRLPGITSALGCAIADVRHDFVQHLNAPLDTLAGADADAVAREHVRMGKKLIAHERIAVDRIDVAHEVDALYQGQTHLFRFPVKSPGFDSGRGPARVRRAVSAAVRYRSAHDAGRLVEPAHHLVRPKDEARSGDPERRPGGASG